MSDNEDYIDVADIYVEEIRDPIEEAATVTAKGRGKDIHWQYASEFENVREFNCSIFKTDINDILTRRKKWKTEEAENENYCCKYQNKKGY